MSVSIVNDSYFHEQRRKLIDWFIASGFEPAVAKQWADIQLRHALKPISEELQCDTQRDYDNLRDGDWTR